MRLKAAMDDFVFVLKTLSQFAFPPFCIQGPAPDISLAPLSASEVILVHADLARQIRDVPDGGQVEIKVRD